MHPSTLIEIALSVVFVLAAFAVALLLPMKFRKPSLYSASIGTLVLLLFFIARPFWIEYQVAQKTEHLNQYLVERYPDEEWIISRQEGRQYSPYHLKVEFKNEKGGYIRIQLEMKSLSAKTRGVHLMAFLLTRGSIMNGIIVTNYCS